MNVVNEEIASLRQTREAYNRILCSGELEKDDEERILVIIKELDVMILERLNGG